MKKIVATLACLGVIFTAAVSCQKDDSIDTNSTKKTKSERPIRTIENPEERQPFNIYEVFRPDNSLTAPTEENFYTVDGKKFTIDSAFLLLITANNRPNTPLKYQLYNQEGQAKNVTHWVLVLQNASAQRTNIWLNFYVENKKNHPEYTPLSEATEYFKPGFLQIADNGRGGKPWNYTKTFRIKFFELNGINGSRTSGNASIRALIEEKSANGRKIEINYKGEIHQRDYNIR